VPTHVIVRDRVRAPEGLDHRGQLKSGQTRPLTPDEYRSPLDGCRLESEEKVLDWLAEIEVERSSGMTVEDGFDSDTGVRWRGRFHMPLSAGLARRRGH
jgi:hypothetical protein